mmetsp:Transcript_61952/g.183024  ORF Transcript_61952/g.183024 Transcript_61952/m.183024 type:complete len:110 (+) Transcript_61952:1502-1831(+)
MMTGITGTPTNWRVAFDGIPTTSVLETCLLEMETGLKPPPLGPLLEEEGNEGKSQEEIPTPVSAVHAGTSVPGAETREGPGLTAMLSRLEMLEREVQDMPSLQIKVNEM